MKEFLIENNQEKTLECYNNQPKSTRELLAEFEKQEQPPLGKLIKFEGANGKDIYNITAPFEIDGEKIIAGRVEGKKIITLTEYSKNNKLSHSNLINKANRQTIEAFLEKSIWKIGVNYDGK